jgi:rod shape-determining protein MreC
MTKFFRKKRLIVLFISLIILVALVGFSLRDNRKLTMPEQFMKDSIGFFQTIFEKPTTFFTTFFKNIDEMKNMFEENKRLKAGLDNYLSVAQNVAKLEKENKELKLLIDKSKEEDISTYTPIHATVISRNPEQWTELIIIDKGETDGVQKNMAVRTAEGLVGKVKNVSKFTSTIQLLSDVNRTNIISAKITQDKGDIGGLIEGFDKSGKYLVFTGIHSDAEVKKKQMVATSGLSGIFPSDLPIGTVEKVETDEFGLTQTAYIKPIAKLNDISHVLVLKRLAPTGEEEK